MQRKLLSILALTLAFFLSLSAFATDDPGSWYHVTLVARGCGEYDSDMIGDACAYVAQEVSSEKVMVIYDSLPQEDSDLGDWTIDHDLQKGRNCFKIQVHQTADLVKRYGLSSYYASKIKREDCEMNSNH